MPVTHAFLEFACLMHGPRSVADRLQPRSPAALQGPPAIRIRHLNHYFGEGELRKQVLFDNNLEVDAGEIVIMTGPSGSGKTTLLTLIGTLRTVQEGERRGAGPASCPARRPTTLIAVRREDRLHLPAPQPVRVAHRAAERADGPASLFDCAADEMNAACHRDAHAAGPGAAHPLTSRASSPAGRSSAWPSPGRWSTGRSWCWPTSRPPRWTRVGPRGGDALPGAGPRRSTARS